MSDYAGKIRDLAAGIRERRAEIEHGRTIPGDLVAALGEADVYRLGLPRALGGEEIDPPDQLQVIETLSAADGSTGWCAMIWLGNGVLAGFMPEPGAKEVFGDTRRPTAASIGPAGVAVRADGGYRVHGRWPFGSGIDHATWVLGGCIVHEDGAPRMTPQGPEIVHVFVPADEVSIVDTWHVSGLRGTGSHDFTVAETFVPDQRVVALFDPAAHRPEPLYQMPILPLFSAHVAAVGLGIARAALDELIEMAPAKVPAMSLVPLAEKPGMQIELARAEAALGGARAFLSDSLSDIWQTVASGREPTRRQHALCRAAAVHAAETSATVAGAANVLAGGSAIYDHSPMQRHARDAEAVRHHATQSPQLWEECGRTLLGLPNLFPIF